MKRLAGSPAAQALLAGCVSFAVFALLRSRHYTAVDGAVRCLEVFHRRELFFHGNNHLLYPADVFWWHRLLGLFGVRAESPLEYLPLTQLLNALAAAGCVAALWRLVHLATGSWRAALGAVLLFGSARAFLLHATNAAEPMLGLFWSLLAVLVLASSLPERATWGALAAGALFALALATYQSMILLAPAAVVLCLARRPVRHLLALAAGGLGAAVLVYGLAYEAMGIAGSTAKVHAFFAIGGAPEVFGGPSLRKLALVPLGLAANLTRVLPADFAGLRSLLRSPLAPVALALSLALVALTALGLVRLYKAWPGLAGRERLAFAAGLAGLAATAAGPAVWDPLYDKLWLQPLACWSFLAALATVRLFSPGAWRWAASALAAMLALNLAAAVAAHRGTTPYLAEAQRVAEIAGPQDLVVHEWDEISVLYGTVWGWSRDRHRFDFPTEALQRRSRVRADLDQAVDAAFARGGKVYFVGLLDAPRTQWDVFLGPKAGIPYEILDPYRAGARVITAFPYRGAPVHLFLWQGPAPAGAS